LSMGMPVSTFIGYSRLHNVIRLNWKSSVGQKNIEVTAAEESAVVS